MPKMSEVREDNGGHAVPNVEELMKQTEEKAVGRAEQAQFEHPPSQLDQAVYGNNAAAPDYFQACDDVGGAAGGNIGNCWNFYGISTISSLANDFWPSQQQQLQQIDGNMEGGAAGNDMTATALLVEQMYAAGTNGGAGDGVMDEYMNGGGSNNDGMFSSSSTSSSTAAENGTIDGDGTGGGGGGAISKKRGCFPKNATNKLKHWLFLNVTVRDFAICIYAVVVHLFVSIT